MMISLQILTVGRAAQHTRAYCSLAGLHTYMQLVESALSRTRLLFPYTLLTLQRGLMP
jgi:hypothetical protein